MTEIDWNVVGRLLVLGIGAVLWGYVAFRRTPDLDDIENAWFYRTVLFYAAISLWVFVWFDLLNVFPL